MLPSIMRVFFGAKKIVEFVPKNADDVEMARTADRLYKSYSSAKK